MGSTHWLVFAALAVMPLWSGRALDNAPTDGSARHRVAFQQLSAVAQDKAKACERISKQLEAASISDRPTVAGQLRDQAREIASANPDFFLGWVWLAQAALALDERADGSEAGANMAALGAAENRSPWIQSLILSLGKKGWIPSQTVAAVAEITAEGQPNSQNPSLNAKDRLEFDTLGQLAIAAEQEPDGEKRHAATDQFLAQSKTFLSTHPNAVPLWLLRGHLCARDDRTEEGMEAANNLQRLGGVESNNPAVHQVMVELNLKGWLHDAAADTPKVENPIIHPPAAALAGASTTPISTPSDDNEQTSSSTAESLASTRFRGKIWDHAADENAAVPITVVFDALGTGGTITYGSRLGDTSVRFTASCHGYEVHAVTRELVEKPAAVKWEGEHFLLLLSPNLSEADYQCEFPASKLRGTLKKE